MLPAKNKSRNKYSDSVLDLINYNQMKIPHLKLTFVIEENNDQTGKVQLTFVVRVIGRELYILWPDQTKKTKSQ